MTTISYPYYENHCWVEDCRWRCLCHESRCCRGLQGAHSSWLQGMALTRIRWQLFRLQQQHTQRPSTGVDGPAVRSAGLAVKPLVFNEGRCCWRQSCSLKCSSTSFRMQRWNAAYNTGRIKQSGVRVEPGLQAAYNSHERRYNYRCCLFYHRNTIPALIIITDKLTNGRVALWCRIRCYNMIRGLWVKCGLRVWQWVKCGCEVWAWCLCPAQFGAGVALDVERNFQWKK